MEIGLKYIVTKSSYDQSFVKGDHITLQENGDISCIEASGWIEKRDVAEATKGMEYSIDMKWIKQQEQVMLKKLKKLGKLKDAIHYFSKEKR